MRWKTKKMIIWIVALIGIIFLRECKHAEREYNMRQRIIELEYEINNIEADVTQKVSDDLLVACEAKIDEIKGK